MDPRRLSNPEFTIPPADENETEQVEDTSVSLTERISHKLNQLAEYILGQENEHPKLHFEVYLSAHGSAEDITNFKKSVEKADIIIPEAYSWTPLSKDLLQLVANGDIDPADVKGPPRMQGFTEQFAQSIHGTHKIILLADVPEGNDIAERSNRLIDPDPEQLMAEYRDFEIVLGLVRNWLRQYVKLNNEREEYIVEQIPVEIKALLKRRPDLNEREDLHILVQLGMTHTEVSHSLSKEYDTDRVFSKRYIQFPFTVEAERRVQFGKKVSKELLAKVALELCALVEIAKEFDTKSLDIALLLSANRTVLDILDYKDIEAIFEAVPNGKPVSESIREKLKTKMNNGHSEE